MRLQKIAAGPHPTGNRIDLSWVNPDPDQYPGVRVVRREGTHPTLDKEGADPPSAEYGVVIADGENLPCTLNEDGHRVYSAKDENLKGETVYYYTLFPYEEGDPRKYQFDRHNRTAAMATAPYDMAGQMYDLLPGIYHRYDVLLPKPGQVPEGDEQKGQLRRFLDLPGGQLDQLYSLARAMLDLHNLDRVDGRLLPLLAQWIGWQTDYRREMDTQRNEIRSAPHVYQTIGIIPTVEAIIKRLTGWESRTKEFVHNVCLSNRPERLNLWLCQRDSSGQWSEPTQPLSLDFAYEGRPAAAVDGDGTLWLFYHTRKGRWDDEHKRWEDQWDIWYKKLPAFSVGLDSSDTREWTPSQPLTNRMGLDKHPTAVIRGETLWVFWDSYDETKRKWRIDYRIRKADGGWSSILTFEDTVPERRRPWAVVDNESGLWLFWLERVGTRWQLKYNRHDGSDWELEPAATFPLDAGEDPRVEGDPFVLFQPADSTPDSTPRLWAFWARKVPTGEQNQTRWQQIAYRTTKSVAPDGLDWGPVCTLEKEEPSDYDDREPAALLDGDGHIQLFWSSNRDGSWSVWHGTLNEWDTAERITGDPYSQRAPLPLSSPAGTWLVYRSNESLTYTSQVYGATKTFDARYAGCTTVDTRNLAKIALQGQYRDFQTYTYVAGQNGKQPGQDWYARDTVGIYLTPATEDQALIWSNQNLVQNVLRRFLPIQVRAVFIIEPVMYKYEKEWVYTYDLPESEVEPQRLIVERFFDSMESLTSEVYSGLGEDYRDRVPDWVWVRAWSKAYPGHRTVDFATTPIDTRFRTWHIGLEAGGSSYGKNR